MKIFRGFHRPGLASACALTIGNFDGVHRGHQAMLALLNNEASLRGVPSCVLTFEPHPRDYFAQIHKRPALAPARIGTLRDKLTANLEVAKDRLLRAEEAVTAKAKVACKTTDQYAHDHPWRLVGLAAVVGFLLGLLVSRR